MLGDLLAVDIGQEEKTEEKEEVHPRHLVLRSRVCKADDFDSILYLQILQLFIEFILVPRVSLVCLDLQCRQQTGFISAELRDTTL